MKNIICALLVTTTLTLPVYAKDQIKARSEINVQYGNNRSTFTSEFWIPLIEGEEHEKTKYILYTDLRLMGDNQGNKEGNLGLGYRRIVGYKGLKGVAGGHAWIDRRITDRGSKFHQLTTGLEWLGETVDVLTNAYFPLNSAKEYLISTSGGGNGSGSYTLAGTGVSYTQTGGSSSTYLIEEPQHGLDFEIGYEFSDHFDIIEKYTDSARFYAGGYYFDGDQTPYMRGGKTRFSIDLTPNVQIGARYQYDNIRESQTFLEATFRFPHFHKKGFRDEGLIARLDDSPERDIDIITGDTTVTVGSGSGTTTTSELLNNATGLDQEILHVDNTAAGGGDGTVETPFDTLSDAQSAASAHSVIYVHAGDGSTTNQDQGITLNQTGLQLIGSGADFNYDSNLFSITSGDTPIENTIITATTSPVITNTNTNDAVTIDTDDVIVSGITVNGANRYGISVSNGDNISLSDLNLTNNVDTGLYTRAYLASSVITNMSVDNVTSSGNGGHGIYIQARNTGTIDGIDINNTTTSNNSDSGIHLDTRTTGSTFDNISIDNLQSLNNTDQGLEFQLRNTTVSSNLSIENSLFDGNGDNGIHIQGYGGSILDNMTISNSTMQNNTSSGLYTTLGNSSTITNATVERNTITNNTEHGVRITDSSTGTIDIDLGGGSQGSVGQNSIYNNTSEEIRLQIQGGTLKAENNFWNDPAGLLPGEFQSFDGSTIDADPFLIVDPN